MNNMAFDTFKSKYIEDRPKTESDTPTNAGFDTFRKKYNLQPSAKPNPVATRKKIAEAMPTTELVRKAGSAITQARALANEPLPKPKEERDTIFEKIVGTGKDIVVGALDKIGEVRRKNEENAFIMRQKMYRNPSDPVRVDPETREITNNALTAYKNAKTEEERAQIMAEDSKRIPLLRALNSSIGKKITSTISDKTSNVILKGYARLIAIGDKTYEEALKQTSEKWNDPENPYVFRLLNDAQNSGIQSIIGVGLAMSASMLTKSPTVGMGVSSAYFSAISAEEERAKYADGNISGAGSLGNIAIDTIGDTILGNVAETILKSAVKEGAETFLKQSAKGFLVEGVTEPTQSVLKYANDYTTARTDADKQSVADSFKEYIRTGGMLQEFLVGGIAGGTITGLAHGAGVAVNYVATKSGKPVPEEKLEAIKQKETATVEKAVEAGKVEEAIDAIAEKHDLTEESARAVVSEIVEDKSVDALVKKNLKKVTAETQSIKAAMDAVEARLKGTTTTQEAQGEAQGTEPTKEPTVTETKPTEGYDSFEKERDAMKNVNGSMYNTALKAENADDFIKKMAKGKPESVDTDTLREWYDRVKKVEAGVATVKEPTVAENTAIETAQKEVAPKTRKYTKEEVNAAVAQATKKGYTATYYPRKGRIAINGKPSVPVATAMAELEMLARREVVETTKGDKMPSTLTPEEMTELQKLKKEVDAVKKVQDNIEKDSVAVAAAKELAKRVASEEKAVKTKTTTTPREIAGIINDAGKKTLEADVVIDREGTQAYDKNNGQEQRNRPVAIPNTGEVRPVDGMDSGGETANEVPGYDGGTVSTEPGYGYGTDRIDVTKLSKKQRQEINNTGVVILEAHQYSKDASQYTQEELVILAAYSGSGGKESVGAEGKGLLSEYYTPDALVSKLWEIALALNPTIETAYEPSAGTGRIISAAPNSVKIDGAELSEVSGTIAAILNQESSISIGDFQEKFFDPKTNKKKDYQTYDLLIGNPPFGARAGFLKGKGEESDINRWEEYFIKRGLDMTNEGGHLVFIVNSSFLQKGTSKGKDAISQLGELVTAYRLPEGTFEDTSVGTDIVVFRKDTTTDAEVARRRGVHLINDIHLRKYSDNVLGTSMVRKNRFGKEEDFVVGSVEEGLTKMALPVASTQEITRTKKVNKETTAKENKERAPRKPASKDDRQKIAPNKTAKVVQTQSISNAKETNTVEVEALKRITRDMTIEDPTDSEKKVLSYDGVSWEPEAIYYSGNIYERIQTLEGNKTVVIAEIGEERYNKQLAGLNAVMPKQLDIDQIVFDPLDRHVASMKLNETNDETVLSGFVKYVRFGDKVSLSPRVWKGDIVDYVTLSRARKGTKPITGFIKSDAKRLFNRYLQTELAPEVQQRILDTYNKQKNAYVQPDYTKLSLEIQDMSPTFRGDPFMLSETQKNGVGFLVNKGSGLIAYGVGVGKTHTLAIATKANMDKGWCKRPVFVVPNATIKDTWIKTLHGMFPTVPINNLGGLQAPVVKRLKKERGDVSEWIKDGEFTIISHDGILRLGFKPDELVQAAGDLNDALWQAEKQEKGTKRSSEKKDDELQQILGNAQRYATDVMFSELGIDHISVDEVHNFRKVFQGAKPEKEGEDGGRKRFANVIGGTPSKRAQQLFLLSQYVQKNNNNRNVFLASATPFENHATEVYNILSFIARDRMKQMGILNINDFFASFANFQVELDRRLDGEWINREKMKSYSNLPTLQAFLREFIDYQEDPTLIRPERRILTPQLQMSEKQEENLVRIQDLLTGQDVFKGKEVELGKEKEEGAFLKASTYSIANSVSPYFIEEYVDEKPTIEELVAQSPKIQYAIEAIRAIKSNPKTKNYGTFVFFGTQGVQWHPALAQHFADVLGYKRSEVAYISGKVTDEEKEAIKKDFNDGKVKVLIGGDQTKEGIDLQNNGFATINLALGWNPTQIAQVEGRVWRQGNRRTIAPLIYPLVENSGDATIYSKFEEKGGRINDIFSYAGTMFDVGEIDPAEKKLALLTKPEDKAKLQIELDKVTLENEKVLIEGDIKDVSNMRADRGKLVGSIDYYKERINSDNSYYSKEAKDEWKKELRKDEQKLARLDERMLKLEITNFDTSLATLNEKLTDVDAKISAINDTYPGILAKFEQEYRDSVAKRKTMAQHAQEVNALADEVQELSEEQVTDARNKKIAELAASKPKFKEKRTSDDIFENNRNRAIRYLERQKKRFGIDFNTYFFENIMFPDKWDPIRKQYKEIKDAYGAMQDNAIMLAKDMTKWTPHHEFGHLVFANLERIDVFKGTGISRNNLIMAYAINKGIAVPTGNTKKDNDERTRIEEEIMLDFEDYLTEKHQPKGLIQRFFEILKRELRKIGLIVEKTNGGIIKDFYDILDEYDGHYDQVDTLAQNNALEGILDAWQGTVLDFRDLDRVLPEEMYRENIRRIQTQRGKTADTFRGMHPEDMLIVATYIRQLQKGNVSADTQLDFDRVAGYYDLDLPINQRTGEIRPKAVIATLKLMLEAQLDAQYERKMDVNVRFKIKDETNPRKRDIKRKYNEVSEALEQKEKEVKTWGTNIAKGIQGEGEIAQDQPAQETAKEYIDVALELGRIRKMIEKLHGDIEKIGELGADTAELQEIERQLELRHALLMQMIPTVKKYADKVPKVVVQKQGTNAKQQKEAEAPKKAPEAPAKPIPDGKGISAFQHRMLNLLEEQNRDDVYYDKITKIAEVAKAEAYYEKNKKRSIDIALGKEAPPADVTANVMALTVITKAQEQKDSKTVAKVLPKLSRQASRQGQEISMLRDAFGENDPEAYMKKLIAEREALVRKKYTPMFAPKSEAPSVDAIVKKKKEEARKRAPKLSALMEMKAEQIDSFLASITC